MGIPPEEVLIKQKTWEQDVYIEMRISQSLTGKINPKITAIIYLQLIKLFAIKAADY